MRDVGGPGPNEPSFGWLPDQKRVWFLSERDGWMHLYTVDASAEQPAARQLTQRQVGDRRGRRSRPTGRRFYITSTEVDPGERHVYALPIDGGERTKLTSMVGASTGEASPDDSTFGLIYSSRDAARTRCT